MRWLLLRLVLIFGSAAPSFADGISDQVLANLKAQGYHVVQMDRTWLGRMWILAENGEVRREIVFNPGTGEILRDYAISLTTLAQNAKGADHDSAPNTIVDAGVVATATKDDHAVVGRETDLGAVAGIATSTDDTIEPINPIKK